MLQERFVAYLEDSIRKNWTIQSLSDYNGESYAYADVAKQIVSLHEIFTAAGIAEGGKIALIGKNSARWCVAYLAVVSYGAVVVPILPDFKPDDVCEIVNHSDSELLISSEAIFETLDTGKMKALKAVLSVDHFQPLHVSNKDMEKSLKEAEASGSAKQAVLTREEFKLAQIPNDSLAVISYTSGTTGHSKGVVLKHNSLAANIRFAQEHMPLNPGDPILSFLPLAHAYGCAFEFLFPFSIGCHITLLTKTPSPQIIMEAFREIRPALVLSVPLVIEKIFKKQLLPVISKPLMKTMLRVPGLNILLRKKIRSKLIDVFGGQFSEIIIGGAPFNREAETFFRSIRFPYTVGYGMTECGPLISYAAAHEIPLGSSGKAVDTLEMRIDSEQPQKEAGEILVRGENVMEGYYKNEEATREVIDEDGWLHTGDLGVMDEKGYVYILGRSKSLILGANGKNIYPEELESRFNNLDGVGESVVVMRDEKLVVLIYPDPDYIQKHKADDSAVRELFESHRRAVNQQVPGYMQISAIELHPEEFVKTPKRSIKRFLYK